MPLGKVGIKIMVDSSFWRNKKVFVTGHTGFKGGWLSLWLQDMGAEVKGYSLDAPTHPSLFEEASVADGMISEQGDIRDLESMRKSMIAFQPEIVIHMAAQPLVRLSYEAPVETYSTNVMGTVNVLECVRSQSGVKAVVNVTSDKCYENQEWLWGYRENEPKGGYDPYSNSKGCAELVADAFRHSFFNPKDYKRHGCAVASVRAGNVIGGGDWAKDRLIPDILNSFERKESVNIRSPFAVRPWQHVLEPLSGYLIVAQKLYNDGCDFAEGWNFGPDDKDARPVKHIVEELVRLWGDDASWILDESPHPHEATYLKLDCSKANSKLNWNPVWNLDSTLEKIVKWHKAWLANKDMKVYSLSEIREYMTNLSA
ncbi:CDP-glucose 4,6-dehydratase [Glaciecola siphonariae]|uniref:CDP-glucose 4,6-dehydratase n=1 Tax=Glaciecola siphonariae TaxID=521012 RepID=A0ABV9LYZ6_9ALTE